MAKKHGRAGMLLASLAFMSAGLAPRARAADTAAGGGVVRLPPAMVVLKSADVDALSRNLALTVATNSSLMTLPIVHLHAAATVLAAQGPVVAVRGDNGMALFPQRLDVGSAAMLVDPRPFTGGVKAISLTREIAAKLRRALDKGDAGSAQRTLAKAFDASGVRMPEESPVVPSRERQRIQSEEEDSGLLPVILLGPLASWFGL